MLTDKNTERGEGRAREEGSPPARPPRLPLLPAGPPAELEPRRGPLAPPPARSPTCWSPCLCLSPPSLALSECL